MQHNRLFQASLTGLSSVCLYDLLTDVKTRIGDGVLSDDAQYTKDQIEKADMILHEMNRRLTSKTKGEQTNEKTI